VPVGCYTWRWLIGIREQLWEELGYRFPTPGCCVWSKSKQLNNMRHCCVVDCPKLKYFKVNIGGSKIFLLLLRPSNNIVSPHTQSSVLFMCSVKGHEDEAWKVASLLTSLSEQKHTHRGARAYTHTHSHVFNSSQILVLPPHLSLCVHVKRSPPTFSTTGLTV